MGGGGGGRAPVVQQVAKAVTPAPTPETPKKPVQYVESGTGEQTTQPTAQPQGDMGGTQQQAASGYVGATADGARLGADKSTAKFIPGAEGEASGDVLSAVLGGDPSKAFRGLDLFNKQRRGFLQGEYTATAEVPGLDASVEAQEGVPTIAGGDPGIGVQTFGNRALAGGEGQVMTNEATGSNAVNTAVPAEQAPSDVQKDPNYMTPSPGKTYIGDNPYQIPFMGAFGFKPGSQAQGRGAISRSLTNPRGGFGKRFWGSGW